MEGVAVDVPADLEQREDPDDPEEPLNDQIVLNVHLPTHQDHHDLGDASEEQSGGVDEKPEDLVVFAIAFVVAQDVGGHGNCDCDEALEESEEEVAVFERRVHLRVLISCVLRVSAVPRRQCHLQFLLRLPTRPGTLVACRLAYDSVCRVLQQRRSVVRFQHFYYSFE